VAGERGASDV
jgi:catalase